MTTLEKPNQHHQYVVGIDFGHGETSAAICELQWDKSAGRTEILPNDIRINAGDTGNEYVLVSAISMIDGEKPVIGKNAFTTDQLDNNAAIRVCFKQPPVDIEGKDEKLMIDYMAAIYKRIREMENNLNDDNHLVYIARPSGWHEEQVKERYRQMARKAGIPLAGLTSESRAAIFYAKNNPRVAFTKQIEQGAIVFDLGSSTLDFTYLQQGCRPIDHGYNLGASIIDRAIYENKMLSNPQIKLMLEKYPQYENALLFKAREIKENIYKTNNHSIDASFNLGKIISKKCSEYEQLKRELIEFEYDSINDFNTKLEQATQYLSKLQEALLDFKMKYIPGKTIHAVFLTGGASRMDFIKDIICRTYGLRTDQVRLDPDNPSLTISRGIAMLGMADSRSDVGVQEIRKSYSTKNYSSEYDSFLDKLTQTISDNILQIVSSELCKFRDNNVDLSVNDLENNIRSSIKDYMYKELGRSITQCLSSSIIKSTNEISGELTTVIRYYAPDAKLKFGGCKQISVDTKTIQRDVNNLIDNITNILAEQVINSLVEIIENVFWMALGTFLFGLFYVGYKALKWSWEMLTTTEEERKAEEIREQQKKKNEAKQKKLSQSDREECFKEVKNKFPELKCKLTDSLKRSLVSNKQLRESIMTEMKKYSESFVSQNLDNVRIPIE